MKLLEPQTCPSCSAPLRSGSGIAYCPRCLMDQTLLDDIDHPGPRTPPEPEELQPHFPDFEIQSFLGAGGMGLVYRAQQKNLNREVALKIVPDDLTNPEFAERFEREARTLARLNHSDFVQIYDHGRVEGWFYIAMEFVDGADFGAVLKKEGHLAPARAHRQISRLLGSLSLAHQQGIVHRDLKPANLILSDDILKVADFGLAKLQEADDLDLSLTGEDAALGTPYYIAPEQLDGSRDVDQRADLYSVGVILYQAVTGVIPTGRYEPASKLSAVPTGFDRVIAKALQPRPSERFQSAAQMQEALDRSMKQPSRLLWLVIGAVLSLLGVWWLGGRETGEQTPPMQASAFLLDQPEVITISAPKDSPDFFGNFTVANQDWLIVGAPDQGFFDGNADESGKVYIYTDDRDLHQVLTCPEPNASDHFGGILELSPRGDLLAVYSRDEEKITRYHLYSVKADQQWHLEQTLVLDLEMSVEDIPPRVILGPEKMIVTSPGSVPKKAIRLYSRDDANQWQFHSPILPATKLNNKAKLGFQARFHNGQLFATASGYNKSFALRSGALLVFEETDGQWQEVQCLEEAKPQALAYFGFDFGFPSDDRILISTLMAKQGERGAAGCINEFQRDPETRQWNFLSRQDPELHDDEQKLFGQQIAVSGDQMLTLSALGSIKEPKLEKVQSRAHLCERDPDGFWQEVLKFNAEGQGDTWLGHMSVLPKYFVIPNPGKNEIYLIPTKAPKN